MILKCIIKTCSKDRLPQTLLYSTTLLQMNIEHFYPNGSLLFYLHKNYFWIDKHPYQHKKQYDNTLVIPLTSVSVVGKCLKF